MKLCNLCNNVIYMKKYFLFELHEFSNYRVSSFLTLFFMNMTVLLKKLAQDIQ